MGRCDIASSDSVGEMYNLDSAAALARITAAQVKKLPKVVRNKVLLPLPAFLFSTSAPYWQNLSENGGQRDVASTVQFQHLKAEYRKVSQELRDNSLQTGIKA